MNNEELKANVARIGKCKKSVVDAEVSKPMSKTPSRLNEKFEFVPTCDHCHIVGYIRSNCPKLWSLSTSKVGPLRWAFFVFWTGLFPAMLWPNSFGIGESGLAQLKLISSQLVHKQGPLCRNPRLGLAP